MNKSSVLQWLFFLTASRGESLSPRSKSDKALRYYGLYGRSFDMIKE
jgi:hypothetical protein